MQWTIGRRLSLAFVAVLLGLLAVSLAASAGLRDTVTTYDTMAEGPMPAQLAVERAFAQTERKVTGVRGYLLTEDRRFLGVIQESQDHFEDEMTIVQELVGAEHAGLVAEVRRAAENHDATIADVTDMRAGAEDLAPVLRGFDERVIPARQDLDQALGKLRDACAQDSSEARSAASAVADAATVQVGGSAGVVLVLTLLLAAWANRSITTSVADALQQVQTSSAELQTAANQQASSAREQATGMTEVATTITELLASSEQIADSARRVSGIAGDTASAANAGSTTVRATQASLDSIRRQVDLIVQHMLQLGDRSQQIGGILDIINELADQTNILAINASIEASGAGEAGLRFGVVADEIRKLADRTGSSAREIRGLIDEVRTSVNTTVMATEGGSKAVDAGIEQFEQLASSFDQILVQVDTTTEAAQEIELGTRQQATSVQQVNAGIAELTQAAQETEATAGQVLGTSTALTQLAVSLSSLVKAG